jgi:hypothetical protein
VYVSLDYTPHVYRVAPAAGATLAITAHSGVPAGALRSAWVDDCGQLLLDAAPGIGLVHDTDLELLIPRFRMGGLAPGEAALAAALDALQDGRDPGLALDAGGAMVPVGPVRAADVPARFGFVQRPVQPAGEAECY